MFNGISATLFSLIVQSIQPIALLPLFLRGWGVEQYGQWLVVTAVIAQLNMIDMGGGNYATNLISKAVASGDNEAARSRLSEAVSLFVVIGILAVVLLTIAVAGIASLGTDNSIGTLTDWQMWTLILLGWQLFAIAIPGGVYLAVYRGSGRQARAAWIGGFARLIGAIALGIVLLIGSGPVGVAGVMAATGVILTLVLVVDSRRVIPMARDVKINLGNARSGTSMLKGSLGFWSVTTTRSLVQQGTVLVLAAVAGPIAVAVFGAHRIIASIASYVWIPVQAPLIPEIVFLHTRSEFESVRKLTMLAAASVMLASGFVAGGLWSLVPVLFEWWTGGGVSLEENLLFLMLIYGIVGGLAWVLTSTLVAANIFRAPAVTNIMVIAFVVVGTFILGSEQGALGAAKVLLAAEAVAALAVLPVILARAMKWKLIPT